MTERVTNELVVMSTEELICYLKDLAGHKITSWRIKPKSNDKLGGKKHIFVYNDRTNTIYDVDVDDDEWTSYDMISNAIFTENYFDKPKWLVMLKSCDYEKPEQAEEVKESPDERIERLNREEEDKYAALGIIIKTGISEAEFQILLRHYLACGALKETHK